MMCTSYFIFLEIKWKTKKYHIIEAVSKSNRKIEETETKLIPATQIYNDHSWLGTGTTIKSGRVEIDLFYKTLWIFHGPSSLKNVMFSY